MRTLADGFVTLRGERSRYFGPDAATDLSLSSATTNLASDLYFRGVRDAGTVRGLFAEPTPLGPTDAVVAVAEGGEGLRPLTAPRVWSRPPWGGTTPLLRTPCAAHTGRVRPSQYGSRSRRLYSLPLGSRGISAMKSMLLGRL